MSPTTRVVIGALAVGAAVYLVRKHTQQQAAAQIAAGTAAAPGTAMLGLAGAALAPIVPPRPWRGEALSGTGLGMHMPKFKSAVGNVLKIGEHLTIDPLIKPLQATSTLIRTGSFSKAVGVIKAEVPEFRDRLNPIKQIRHAGQTQPMTTPSAQPDMSTDGNTQGLINAAASLTDPGAGMPAGGSRGTKAGPGKFNWLAAAGAAIAVPGILLMTGK